VHIRVMTAADVERVAQLAGQLGYPSTSAHVAARFELLRQRPDEGLFVAVGPNAAPLGPTGSAAGHDAVIAWVHVRPTLTLESDPCAEIAGLVVNAADHGHGVGRALVAAAEAWAVEHGFREIRVRSNVVRLEAHAFYRHLGYEVVKNQLNFRKRL
jgi:GNAT superfamily N-acetyltransferase